MTQAITRFFARDLKVAPEVLGVNAEAEAQQLVLSTSADKITTVTTVAEQDAAVEVSRDIRSYAKRVRTLALEFRRPLNTVAANIKRVEDEHLAPLEEHQHRIERLIADFQQKEDARVAEETKRRQEELERLAQEQREAEAKAAALAEKAKTTKQMDRAAEAEAAAHLAEVKKQQAIMQPPPEAVKAKGVAVKRVLRWEVTDLMALVQSRPDLCKIEPKPSAIQSTCIPEMPNLPPGLRLWWETVANTRTR